MSCLARASRDYTKLDPATFQLDQVCEFRYALLVPMAADFTPRTVAAFSSNPWNTAVTMLRLECPLKQAGLKLVPGCEWHDGALAQFEPQSVASADIVVIQRDFPRHADVYDQVTTLARTYGKPVVYELDDWLLDLPAEHLFHHYYQEARLPMLRAIVQADAVTVSTPELRRLLEPFNPVIYVLPNLVDEHLWPALVEPVEAHSGPLVVGYMGGFTHVADIASIEPALEQMLHRHAGRVILKFFGGTPPPPKLQSEATVEWDQFDFVNYAEFAAHFSDTCCDLFLAPLLDNPFNRAKSPIKFLEYSTLGAPGIYSRLPPYENIVTHGENGFLAATLEEWVNCLNKLIEDAALRQRLGAKARETVRQSWLLSQHAHEWAAAYQAILSNQRAEKMSEQAALVADLAEIWRREQAAEVEGQHQAVQAKQQALQARLADTEAEAADLSTQLAMKEEALRALAAKEQAASAQLSEITSTRAWKLMQLLWKMRRAAAPPRERGQ